MGVWLTSKPRHAWHWCMASVHGWCMVWCMAWCMGGVCWIGGIGPEHWGLVLDEVW